MADKIPTTAELSQDGEAVKSGADREGGGWFASGKRDLREIVRANPENAGRNWLVWSCLIAEANRIHSIKVRLTRAQIGLAAGGLSVRSVSYALEALRNSKMLRYQAGRDRATGRKLTATITLNPSASPVGIPLPAGNVLPKDLPWATDEGASIALLLTKSHKGSFVNGHLGKSALPPSADGAAAGKNAVPIKTKSTSLTPALSVPPDQSSPLVGRTDSGGGSPKPFSIGTAVIERGRLPSESGGMRYRTKRESFSDGSTREYRELDYLGNNFFGQENIP